MAAWADDQLILGQDASPPGRVKGGDVRVVLSGATSPASAPLLPLPEPAQRVRRGRYLFLSELDGPDYEAAADAADQAVTDRDGARWDSRPGWTKDAA